MGEAIAAFGKTVLSTLAQMVAANLVKCIGSLFGSASGGDATESIGVSGFLSGRDCSAKHHHV